MVGQTEQLVRKILIGLEFSLSDCPESAKKKTADMILRAYKRFKDDSEIESLVREEASPAVSSALAQLEAI